MKNRNKLIIILFVLATGASIAVYPRSNLHSWDKQLNEMNYLIIRTSSINIINGINLTPKQVVELRRMTGEIMALNPPIPDMRGDADKDLVNIRKTYLKLVSYLIYKKKIPKRLKNEVTKMRILESEIIKKSILGAKEKKYKGKGCLKCHSSPDAFPKGDVSLMNTPRISMTEREKIDRAHAYGLYGERGIYKLWELKSKVDALLTNGQRLMLKDFECCLIPPESLSNPANIGQAFVSDEWMNYFRKVRKVSKEYWPNLKYLYIVPIEDYIIAALPSITSNDKEKILLKTEKILEDVRKLDDVDFELQKEAICLRFRDEINMGSLLGEKEQQKEKRQFLAAMFLLLPGNEVIFDKFLKQKPGR